MEEQIATLTRKVRVSERDAREKSSSVILQKQKLTAGTEVCKAFTLPENLGRADKLWHHI